MALLFWMLVVDRTSCKTMIPLGTSIISRLLYIISARANDAGGANCLPIVCTSSQVNQQFSIVRLQFAAFLLVTSLSRMFPHLPLPQEILLTFLQLLRFRDLLKVRRLNRQAHTCICQNVDRLRKKVVNQ